MASSPNEFLSYVLEAMSHRALVSARRMFGGFGLYRDGLMFALIVQDELFFKTDAENVAQFERAGSHPFSYQTKARIVKVVYWSAPAECLESPSDMSDWCQLGFAAARRAAKSSARKAK
ncbi:MAG: TfoX/Sxy family protein [Gallionella sp.]